MTMTNKSKNLDLCFIYQKNTKKLVRSTGNGGKHLALMLLKFESKKALGSDINRIHCSDKEFLQTLRQNEALYHPSCKNK